MSYRPVVSRLALTALLFVACLLAQVLLPWWWVAVPVCILGGYWLGRSGGMAFSAGFFGVGSGWVLAAAVPWALTQSALPGRVAQLLSLPGGGLLLVALAGLISGLLGGIAALAGWWLRQTGGRGTVESPYSKPVE